MKLIDRRRKLEANKEVTLDEVLISSSSESEDDRDDRDRPKPTRYDFEDRNTQAWKQLDQDDEDFENFDSAASREPNLHLPSEEDESMSGIVTLLGKRIPSSAPPPNQDQLLSTIVLESQLTPETIRKANLAELAAKKNTVKHLQTTNMPIRGIDIYRAYLKWHKIDRKSKEWTAAENARLAKYVEVFSDTRWKQISTLMDGRTPYDCRRQWFQKVSPYRQTVRWDNPTDDLLIGLGALEWSQGKRVKWAKVANLFEGRRNELQVRERYANILDPGLGEIKTEPSLEEKVLELYDQIGSKWSKIAKHFPGLTDNQIKRVIERAFFIQH